MNIPMKLSVMIGEVDGAFQYCAHCLDFDLLGYGNTHKDAIMELVLCIVAYLDLTEDEALSLKHFPIDIEEAYRGFKNREEGMHSFWPIENNTIMPGFSLKKSEMLYG